MRSRLQAQLGDLDLYVTKEPGDATRRVREALQERSCFQILVAGGDGTINEAVNGYYSEGRLLADDIPLGVIDIGTGGDFFRTLTRLNPHYANSLKENLFKRIDCGEISFPGLSGANYFVNIASVGMAAGVLRRLKSSRFQLKGASFYYHTLRTLIGYKPQTFQVRIVRPDQTELQFEQKLFNMFLCNGRFSGGGMCWSPGADLCDGALDLVLVGEGSKLRLVADTPKIYRGDAGSMASVSLFQASEVELEIPAGEQPELDGEVLDLSVGTRRIVFRNRPSELPVIL